MGWMYSYRLCCDGADETADGLVACMAEGGDTSHQWEALADAKKAGWTRKGRKSYCPKHSPKKEKPK